jgi:predicted Zn-dependent protease
MSAISIISPMMTSLECNRCNSAILWDSYRGPLQYDSKKKQYVIDFHRVALHEFGHTLGLDHPDEAGQSVVAIIVQSSDY